MDHCTIEEPAAEDDHIRCLGSSLATGTLLRSVAVFEGVALVQ